MHAAAPYPVEQSEGRWPSVLLALAVHAALLAFLWVGVRWQSEPPVAMEAEVWDMQVQEAAPQAPPVPEPVVEDPPEPIKAAEPEPVPEKEPEISLEQVKKREAERLAELKKQEELEKQRLKELEQKKLAEAKKQKELAAKKEQELADKLRKDAVARMMAGTAGPSSTGTAPRSTGPRGDPSYAAEVTRKIKSNITYGGETEVPGNPTAEYRITQLPSGEIVSARRIKSSGIPAYDAAVEKAIAKSSPLPKKKDGTVEREIVATFILKE
jgi:colicin import membrane protein